MNRRPTLCFLLALAACAPRPERAAPAASRQEIEPPRCSGAGFERWTDAPVRVYLLDGHTLQSDGREVAVRTGSRFEKRCGFGLPPGHGGDRFVGFVGRYPEATFSVVSGRETSRLLRNRDGGWEDLGGIGSSRVSIGTYRSGALWLSLAGSDYELGVLGVEAAPTSQRGTGAGCPKRLASPSALASTPFGEAALLGSACGATPPRFAVEIFPGDGGPSRFIEGPPHHDARALALTWRAVAVGGAREGAGWLAVHVATGWRETPPLPSAVTALALGTQGELWAATDSIDTRIACGGGFEASNLWKRTASGWQNVALPNGAGRARSIVWEPEGVWVTTERGLYRSLPAAQSLAWSEPCR